MNLKEMNQPIAVAQLKKMYLNDRVSHAYVLDGPRGSGKKELALFFAQLLKCEDVVEGEPCGVCSSCRRIEEGNHPNVSYVVPDGQYIKKEQIEQLMYQMTRKGYEAGRKIYMIEEAHRLHPSAANALLKFLEEPEGSVTALLLTDSYHSMLATIQSRCQRVMLARPDRRSYMERLMTTYELTESLASTVSQLTFDEEEAVELSQDASFLLKRQLAWQFVTKFEQAAEEAVLFLQQEWANEVKSKEDLATVLSLILYIYRDMVTVKVGNDTILTYPDEKQSLEKYAFRLTYEQLSVRLDAILEARRKVESNMNRTLLMEQLVFNMQEG